MARIRLLVHVSIPIICDAFAITKLCNYVIDAYKTIAGELFVEVVLPRTRRAATMRK